MYSMFAHVPGLKVVAPTTPHDAKGCMIAAIRDNNPVIFLEHRMLYNFSGLVPEADYEIPFGKARVLTEGADVTIVAVSHMVVEALRASRELAQVGIEAEVIDPVSLAPLDMDTVNGSVGKTGRLLVVDNDWSFCGIGAEIVASVAERYQGRDFPRLSRMGFAPVPCPTTKSLENLFYPNAGTIASAAYKLVKGPTENWAPVVSAPKEVAEFRGPF